MTLTFEEYGLLIREALDGRCISGRFGPGWVTLEDVQGNEWARRRIEEIRSEMIRRTYKITAEQDREIADIARDANVDKEQVVQAGLHVGLPEVRRRWERAGRPQGLEFFRAVLIEVKEERINKAR